MRRNLIIDKEMRGVEVAKRKGALLSLNSSTVLGLALMLLGLPLLISYSMSMAGWFDSDSTVHQSPYTVEAYNSSINYSAGTTGIDILGNTTTNCSNYNGFYWIDSGELNATWQGQPSQLYCGWSPVLNSATGMFGGVVNLEDEWRSYTQFPPCLATSTSQPNGYGNMFYGDYNCGSDSFEIGLPSGSIPQNETIINLEFFVLGSAVWGLIMCGDDYSLSYKYEVKYEGQVVSTGASEHPYLWACDKYNATTPTLPYLFIDHDFNMIDAAKFNTYHRKYAAGGPLSIRVFDFVNENTGTPLKDLIAGSPNLAHSVAGRWGAHTAFEGHVDMWNSSDGVGCTTLYLPFTSAPSESTCAIHLGMSVESAHWAQDVSPMLSLLTWGLAIAFSFVAIASTSLWNPFIEGVKKGGPA